MSFDSLQLHPKILKALNAANYTTPTEIQLKAIPKVLEGCDIRGSAQTGTGKTAAFLLPALHKIETAKTTEKRKGPRILIVAPTRELATQIANQCEKYSKYLEGVKTVAIGGGVPYEKQRKKLSRPYDILVATPGRLIDFMHQGKIDLSHTEMVVLDEADRMLDMGFYEPVQEILSATPTSRQTLLFSATLRGSIEKLSKRFLQDPIDIEIHQKHARHDNIEQRLHFVDDLHHKNRLLNHILQQDDVGCSIIFTSTKRHAGQLVDELDEKGFEVGALHGDMSQRQRTRMVKELKSGNIQILVATDVAARGIDVQDITHVINFDLPRNIEDYVHRIGRTGRAGSKGIALSFAARRDKDLLKKIETFTGHKIEITQIPGFEPGEKQNKRSKSNKKPFSSFDPSKKRVRLDNRPKSKKKPFLSFEPNEKSERQNKHPKSKKPFQQFGSPYKKKGKSDMKKGRGRRKSTKYAKGNGNA